MEVPRSLFRMLGLKRSTFLPCMCILVAANCAILWIRFVRNGGDAVQSFQTVSNCTGLRLPPLAGKERGSRDEAKMAFVKEMASHAWNSYVQHAWGHDDVAPISKTHYDWYKDGNILLNTPIDALDTLYIMGLHAEYKAAKKLILAHDFSRINTTISIFETIIRVVGGLLAAYDLDGDKRVLRKCVELVDAMLPAFDTITGLPVNDFRISDGFKKVNDDKGVGLAEIGTFQLEFQYLSDVTGNPIYAEKALRVYEQLAKVKVPIPGLYPEKIHADNLTILGKVKISLGGMSDSYYEYLLKMWLATGHEKFYKLYETAANSFAKYMVKYSNDGFLYIPTGFVTRDDPALEPQIQFEDIFNHLACFAGGMFSTGAVAARTLHHPRSEWAHLYEIGQNLTEYCWQMYNRTNSGIGPEVVFGATLTSSDGRYQLRPETIESLFYMWRYTHAGVYRERAWTIAQAIDRYCRVPGGYHSLANVESPRQGGLNRQESFFLAETLKYLYLIFADDDTIALEKYVFNTEAHVLSVRGHGRRKQASDFVPLPYR